MQCISTCLVDRKHNTARELIKHELTGKITPNLDGNAISPFVGLAHSLRLSFPGLQPDTAFTEPGTHDNLDGNP